MIGYLAVFVASKGLQALEALEKSHERKAAYAAQEPERRAQALARANEVMANPDAHELETVTEAYELLKAEERRLQEAEEARRRVEADERRRTRERALEAEAARQSQEEAARRAEQAEARHRAEDLRRKQEETRRLRASASATLGDPNSSELDKAFARQVLRRTADAS